ncbi:hypothetical protein Focb16_v014391 [Fusarium oxysporum f. sp. cubense]|uniref:Uncharacterized protein n=1 Tax=Fusarium oxysporum f. sp. cubense TaxID=61366 RepID=A0A559KSL1_FUSOC|nr:hypothetical protein Focb16_v014391 [Fusarium oxysporum f. sp. cubense]
MASSGAQKTFDHSNVDFLKVGPRRAHMKAYFLHLGLWNEERVKACREYSEEQTCLMAYKDNYTQINQVTFEFIVDYFVWYNLLKVGNALGQGHDWPWPMDAAPDKKDVTSDGASGCYQTWRIRKLESINRNRRTEKRSESKVPLKGQATPGASSSQGAVAAETAEGSSAASKAPEIAPVQQAPNPVVGEQAVRFTFGQPASRPRPEQQAPKPLTDNSVGIAQVAAALADITLGAAAGESAKKGKGKEKAIAEAERSDVKAARLDEKLGCANAIFDDEVVDIGKQRSYINDKKFAEATATAVVNEHSPDDWYQFAVDDDDDEPVIPSNEVIPVRHDFGANNDVKCEGPMAPVPEYLQDMWEGLRLGMYSYGPIIGPFEIALPEWIDFHDLVYGDDGALYALIEDQALIDRDIVITWAMKNGRPISLVVGPKPSHKCDYEDKQLWLRTRATWLKVAEWVFGVYFGRPHRLTDFLRYRQEQELMEVPPLSLDEVMSLLMRRWDLMSHNPAEAALDAQSQREELDVWVPQLHAILSQPWGYASKIAETWVIREGVDVATRRLEAAEYTLAAFRPQDAYRWGRDVHEVISTYSN